MNFANDLAGDALGGRAIELRETLVAVEDRAVAGERQRAFAHLLDHQPVRLVGAAQGEDLFARRRT